MSLVEKPVALLARILSLCAPLLAGPVLAHGPSAAAAAQPVPAALQVRAELQPQPGVTDLKFRDFFKLPIGPRGLEATALLRSLDAQAVRIVGYMVRQENAVAVAGLLVLTPLPVTLGDEDETFADDLPATAVYVHLAPAQAALRLPHMPGLMALTGTLQVGGQAEPDGRRSLVRLLLNDAVSREFDPPATSSSGPSFSVFMEKLNESTR